MAIHDNGNAPPPNLPRCLSYLVVESTWMLLSDGQLFHRQPKERTDGWLSECLAVFQPWNNEGPASQIGHSLRYHYAKPT